MQYFLSFLINNVSLGVPIDEVQEIARPKDTLITKKTNIKNLLGFFKLRNVAIPLYDLPGHLALEHGNKVEVIVVHHKETVIGMLVDRVLGIIATPEIIPYPDIIPQQAFLVGVIPETNPLLQVISLTSLFTQQRIKKIQDYIACQAV